MSLIDCLKKIGLEEHYAAIAGDEGGYLVSDATRRNNVGQKDAARAAVLAYIEDLRQEHATVVQQIQSTYPEFQPLHRLGNEPTPEVPQNEQSQNETPQAPAPETPEVTVETEQAPTVSDEALTKADYILDNPSAPGSKWTYREVQREAADATRASQPNLGRNATEESEGEPGEASAESSFVTRSYLGPGTKGFVNEDQIEGRGYSPKALHSPLSSVWRTLANLQHFGTKKAPENTQVKQTADGVQIGDVLYTKKATADGGYEMVTEGKGGQREADYRLVKKANRWVIERAQHGASIEGQTERVSRPRIIEALHEGYQTARGLVLGYVGKDSAEGPPKDYIALRTTASTDVQKLTDDTKFTADWLKNNQDVVVFAAKTLRKVGALLMGRDNATPEHAKQNVNDALSYLMSEHGLELAQTDGLDDRVIWTPKGGKSLEYGKIANISRELAPAREDKEDEGDLQPSTAGMPRKEKREGYVDESILAKDRSVRGNDTQKTQTVGWVYGGKGATRGSTQVPTDRHKNLALTRELQGGGQGTIPTAEQRKKEGVGIRVLPGTENRPTLRSQDIPRVRLEAELKRLQKALLGTPKNQSRTRADIRADIAATRRALEAKTGPELDTEGKPILGLKRVPTREEVDMLSATDPETMKFSDNGQLLSGLNETKRETRDADEDLANRPVKTQTSTRAPDTPQITNNARSLPKELVDWIGDWLKEIGVTTRLTLTDATVDIGSLDPNRSWFIAQDAKSRKNGRRHLIYIPKGLKADEQARDLMHELGHYLQRNVLDGMMEQAAKEGNTQAQELLAQVMGVASIDDYFGLSDHEKRFIEERFADLLAIAAFRQNTKLTAKGKTIRDVLASKDATTFFDRMADLLRRMWAKIKAEFPGAKEQLTSFERFIEAMTGRDKQWAKALEGFWAKTLEPRGRRADKTQASPLKIRAYVAKLRDSTTIDNILGVYKYLLSAQRQLKLMTNRAGTESSKFTRRLAQKMVSYESRLRFHTAQFDARIMSIANMQPFWDQDNPAKTPNGRRAASLIQDHLIRQTPLDKIPHTKITVERLHSGKKNVEVDIHEMVKTARAADRFLWNYAQDNGIPLPKIENHWARMWAWDVLKKSKALQDKFIEDMQKPAKEEFWHGNRKVMMEDTPWSKKDAQEWMDRLINQDLEFPFTIDRLMEGRGETDEEIGKILDDPMKMKLWGSTEHSHKKREFPEARWAQLMYATSALTSEVFTQRATQMAKYIAINEAFGGGIVMAPGETEPRLLNQKDYHDYHAQVRSDIDDAILLGHGHPDLTVAAIKQLKGQEQHDAWGRRKATVAGLMEEDAETKKWADDEWQRIAGNDMWDPLGEIEVGLSHAYHNDDLSYRDAHRVKTKIVPAYLGRLGQKELPGPVRVIQSYILTGMGVSMLPWAVLSSLAEITQIGTRLYEPSLGISGRKAHGAVMRTLWDSIMTAEGKERYAKANEIAHSLGIVKDYALEHALASMLEAEFMPLNVRKFNAAFFRRTGLKAWTDMTRTIAVALGHDAIQAYGKLARNGNKVAIAQLQRIGLTADDVMTWISAPDHDDLTAPDNKKIAEGLDRWVNEATLRPRAATRPVFGSDPRFALVWYLKDFPWAMFAGTMNYVYRQSKLAPNRLARMTPWLVAAIPMMMAGALGQWLKDMLSNQLPAAALGVQPKAYDPDPWNQVLNAAKRSGVMGPAEMIWQAGENMQHRGLPWIGLFSPAAGILQDMAIRGSWPTAMDRMPPASWFSRPVRDAVYQNLGMK